MNILKKNKIYVFIMYINFIFIFQLMRNTYEVEDFDFLYASALFFVSVLFFFLLNYLVRKRILRIIILFLVTILCLMLLNRWLKDGLFMELFNNIDIINRSSLNGVSTYFSQFKLILCLTIPFSVYLILFLADVSFTDSILLGTTGVVITLWFIGYAYYVKKTLSYYLFVSIVTYAYNNSYKVISKLKSSGKANAVALFTVVLIPAFIMTLFINVLPKDFSGKYNITIMGSGVNQSTDGNAIQKSAKLYSLSDSGYVDSEHKLGGPLTLNDKLILKVKSDKPEYLAGTVEEHYDGIKWSKISYNYIQASDLRYQMSVDEITGEFNTKNYSMTVIPQNIFTTSFFTPLNTYNINAAKGNTYYESRIDYTDIFKTDLPSIKQYSLEYYDNIDADNLATSDKLEWFNGKTGSVYDKSKSYLDDLQLPPNITERTEELVHKITADAKSRSEQVQKIKQYLVTSYPYSLNVSEVPDKEEFLDYFLFTEKKGYCVYFATAMTIMCRMCGIPARYVEGFKMPDKPKYGYYLVTNKEAHAWCQVLVDPLKNIWSNVEATPADNTSPSVPTLAKTPDEVNKTIIKSKPSIDKNTNDKKAEARKDFNISSYWTYMVSILIFSILTVKVLMRFIKINKMLSSKSNLPLYNYLKKRLKCVKIYRPENLGDLEYANSIEDINLRFNYRRLVEACYEEHYGGTFSLQLNRHKIFESSERYIRKKQNIFLYVIRKYLL